MRGFITDLGARVFWRGRREGKVGVKEEEEEDGKEREQESGQRRRYEDSVTTLGKVSSNMADFKAAPGFWLLASGEFFFGGGWGRDSVATLYLLQLLRGEGKRWGFFTLAMSPLLLIIPQIVRGSSWWPRRYRSPRLGSNRCLLHRQDLERADGANSLAKFSGKLALLLETRRERKQGGKSGFVPLEKWCKLIFLHLSPPRRLKVRTYRPHCQFYAPPDKEREAVLLFFSFFSNMRGKQKDFPKLGVSGDGSRFLASLLFFHSTYMYSTVGRYFIQQCNPFNTPMHVSFLSSFLSSN